MVLLVSVLCSVGKLLTRALALSSAALAPVAGLAAPASAKPAPAPAPSSNGPRITDEQQVADNWWKITVYSPAMDKEIVNDVLRSPVKSAPTFYLLQGTEGGQRRPRVVRLHRRARLLQGQTGERRRPHRRPRQHVHRLGAGRPRPRPQ
jgi:hypothetical protein